MSRPVALDLFAGAGGVSFGLYLAGFDVVAVDSAPMPHHPAYHDAEYARHFAFHQADALTFPLDGYDFIWASPPCQAHSSLRHLHKTKVYPDLIPATRERLMASGTPYCIENVEGAPLGASGYLIMLCGTMFGLQTPDGRAELRRHRLFETSFSIPLRPACQHGHVSQAVLGVGGGKAVTGGMAKSQSLLRRETLSVVGKKGLPGLSHGRRRVLSVSGHASEISPSNWGRRSICVTGNTAQTNTVRNQVRETFSTENARAAMGIPWMPMKYLSQAIPPMYGRFIGEQALEVLAQRRDGTVYDPPEPRELSQPTEAAS